MKIGFFGTPELAKQVLHSLIQEENIEVAFVVTNPDKPVGRKKLLTPTPVKLLAQQKNIAAYTPKTIRNNNEFYKILRQYGCDYFIIVAYGKILPADFLEIPKYMCINIHGSLLPKYRGASPIQSALLSGEKETGVTIMKMSEGMDEGDIISKEIIQIDKTETTSTLFKKFGEVSPRVLIKSLKNLENSKATLIPQNSKEATYCTKIKKEDGNIDWNLPAKQIYHMWQAYTPWPGIYSFFDDKKIAFEQVDFDMVSTSANKNLKIGTVIEEKGRISVICGEGILYVEVVKLAGKQSQGINDFLRGHQQFIGYTFDGVNQ